MSCYDLGILYEKGQGVGRDYHIAKELFGKACDLGLQPGCDFYKKLNEKGFYYSKNNLASSNKFRAT
ncbi:hypothetical protein B9N62_06750 [Campylobacter concisus]|uniref:beta-lactamase n=2 Tax=Campylobacter concisus TaxID=199 RepID=A0A1Y5MVM7_9BACT|nr:hypothetical protein B9N62_06750 [Campylobacter concisus]